MRPETVDRLQDGLGITSKAEAAIIARLFRARGQAVPTVTINESTAPWSKRFDHAAPIRTAKTVKVLVCYIRRRLGHDFIVSEPWRGYALSPAGLARCRAALQ